VLEVLGAVGIGGQEWQVYIDFLSGAELYFGLFGFVAQALHGGVVIADVYAVFFFELVGKVVYDDAVKVGTTEVRVAIGALYFKHAVAEL
jgi:hypothetical protein